jgi:hypothetical protein
MPFSISGLLSSRETDIDQRADIGRGMIIILKWKKACINLLITYVNIELKRTKLTSHTDTKPIWIWVIDIGWGVIAVLLWKKSCIDLFIYRNAWYRVIRFLLWHFLCLRMGSIYVITYTYVTIQLYAWREQVYKP